MKRLKDRLAELIDMSPAQLRAEWRQVFRKPPPPLSPDLLARGIAYRLQEKQHGGLAPATVRELNRLARDLAKNGELRLERETAIKPGTRLVRDWGERSHHITVLDQGFLYEDRHYSSLTQIARAITGARWSGPRFFGIKKRSRTTSRKEEALG